MNWKLILGLSMFGLGMAFATVYFVDMDMERFIWPVILIIVAILIGKKAPGKYFQHGFFVCLLNCIWITGTHILLFDTYFKTNAASLIKFRITSPDLHAMIPVADGSTSMITVMQSMIIIGSTIGIVTGIVEGLLALLASRILRR